MTATAKVSRTIPAPPETVWETLTTKEGMKAYMMGADVETDWQVGHPFVMKGEFKGKAFEDAGEVRSFEPERRFSYTHASGGGPAQHLVTFELRPVIEGSEVTVTQEPLNDDVAKADAERLADYEKNWSMMLEGVEKAATA